MPNNDLEVFDHLCADQDTEVEIDYLTYAIFAHKKAHWIVKFELLNGRKTTHTDIDNWISQLTDYDFGMMRTEAAEFFHVSAFEYMKNEIEEAKSRGREESIAISIRQIKLQLDGLGSLRNQLLIALVTAALVPPILGGMIFAIRQFEIYMPSIAFFSASTNLPITSPQIPAPPAGR